MAAGTPDRRSAKPNGSTPQPGPPNVGHQSPYGYGIPQYMNSYPLPPMPPAQMYPQHHHMTHYPHYGYQQPIYQHPVHPPQGYPPMQYMPHMPAPHPHYPSPTLAGPYQHSPSPWSPVPNIPPADPGMSTPPVYATPTYAPPPHMHHGGQTLYQSSQPFIPRNVPPSPSGNQMRHLASPHTAVPQIRSPSLPYARVPDQSQLGDSGSGSPPSLQTNQPTSLPTISVDQQGESTVVAESPVPEQTVPVVEPITTTISSPPSQPPPQPPPPLAEDTKTQVEEAQEDGGLRFSGGRIPTPNADSIITFAAPPSVPSTSSPPPNDSDVKGSTQHESDEGPGQPTTPLPQTFISAPVFTDPAKDEKPTSDSSIGLLSPTTSGFLEKDIPEATYSITSRRPEVDAAPALSFSRRAKIPTFILAVAVPLTTPPKPVKPVPVPPVVSQSTVKPADPKALAPQANVKQSNEAEASKPVVKSQKPDAVKPSTQPSEIPQTAQSDVSSVAPVAPTAPAVPVSDQATPAAPEAPVVPQPAPPVKPPPKSWAHLLRPASPAKPVKPSQPQSQKPAPAVASAGSKQTPDAESKVNGHPSVNGGYEPLPTSTPLHVVLSEGAKPYSAHSQVTQPRGLINSGNMCFANVVLQALVYSAPFVRLFETLAHLVPGSLNGKTSLYEATILFLREFPPQTEPPPPAAPKAKSRSGTSTPMAPEQTRQQVWNENPFIPELLYEAMKQNKRFDSMQRGHQEDAEEFLGFFLDTLHEELLSMISRVQTEPTPAGAAWTNGPPGKTATGDNAREVQRPVSPDTREDDSGWMEVGKKNKPAITRTTRATESAITRIFGGKLRSVLSIPGSSKDSVTLEPYQPLQLDIQSDHIRTIEDALKHITVPEIVSMHSETRGGMVEARKQVTLESLPPLLILHLKRLVYDAKGIQKNSKVIEYSTTLEIRPEIISPTRRTKESIKYKLYGVVYHLGKHATGGHYTIDVLRQDHSEWVRIDDTHIEPVTEKDVTAHEKHAKLDKTAYLLFYRREPENPK
ncbi:unnamed protein product [Rhizoctonia solani]|uniref:ubiquitinyl hydrolase 1 n=1 Tax=Rhizoctonia solani TaxID=456999 RepID=A0A8H3HUD7_9AGAM|nr:unnamed protein product [Rhizoctonia solani]